MQGPVFLSIKFVTGVLDILSSIDKVSMYSVEGSQRKRRQHITWNTIRRSRDRTKPLSFIKKIKTNFLPPRHSHGADFRGRG